MIEKCSRVSEDVDGGTIGERSDAVLRTATGERSDAVLQTAMPGYDELSIPSERRPTDPVESENPTFG